MSIISQFVKRLFEKGNKSTFLFKKKISGFFPILSYFIVDKLLVNLYNIVCDHY